MIKQDIVKIIPLGGLGEIGCNMTIFEYQDKILIVDVGFKMPEESMPGIDYVIPNSSYLKGKEKNVVGIVFTHGHYDHIGAVPYIISKIWRRDLPIYASPLTKGIIIKRQLEFSKLPKLNIDEVRNGSIVKLKPFTIEFFSQNHNIPDNLGLIINTPLGNIVHTSDFKFDPAPVNDLPTDFKKLESIGNRKVLLLMSDSTGAEEEGHSLSEKDIFQNLEKIFQQANGRIIAATFSSLINRIQQMVTLAEKYKRKVIVEGRSMKTNIEISRQLGYFKIKKGTLIGKKNMRDFPDSKIIVLCTGAQGESSAALMRIVNREDKTIRLQKGDSMVLSSSVIPGNERSVQNLKDNILRQGAKVFHYKMMDIHAGGHAQKEELEKMIRIMKPKFFIPIHGQYSMLFSHAQIARETGILEKNIVVAENGQIVDLDPQRIFVEAKTVISNHIMVDGLGVGDVGEVVLRDRKMLAEDGMFVIVAVIDRKTGQVKGSPDIISRGFVYLRESKILLGETRKRVVGIINRTTGSEGAANMTYVKDEIRNKIGEFLFLKTQRRPMVLPVIIEV
ncbi:ribonuclease J [Patescibacteria group bacterium]|nr:ribonuclease J [Patescibacteria group bacterium]MBU1876749.1 ribonuclease J [Patescibacteria group bacterium]